MASDDGRDLVFVSYSHDDAEWAQRFTVLLKPLVRTKRLRMWIDTANIRAGARWHPEIERGIERSRVALLLVSGSFLASDYIMETELPALVENGVTLAPVLVEECLWEFVPELSQVQWLHDPGRDGALADAGDRSRRMVGICRRLIAELPDRDPFELDGVRLSPRGARIEVALVGTGQLAAAAPPAGAIPPGPTQGRLSGVPALPPGYVVRDELAVLIGAVVERPTVGVTGTPTALGVHGQGGIGKSVLIAALARDDEVRHRFPDGVFWVTVGETPDLLGLQLDLLARLGGPGPTARTVADAADDLRALLANRRVLLVVDDVWTADAVLAFRVTGAQGRVVHTTRDPVLAGARAHRVDVLSADGARALAEGVLGGPVPAAAEQAFARVGHVPLAVALLAAAVRGGRTWEDLATTIDHDVFGDHPYANAFAAMRVAVEALPADLTEALLSLAVFGPDTRIPLAAVDRYWTDRPADATLSLLAAAGVLQRDGDTIGFHDLQHEYLLLHAPPLDQLHAALLAAYRSEPEWWQLPIDEPYIWDHLVEHLIGAGEDAVATVTDPAYLAQRIRVSGTHGAEADLAAVRDDGSVGWWRDWIARHAHLLNDVSDSDTVIAATMHAWLGADPAAGRHGVDTRRLRLLLTTPYLAVRWGLEAASTMLVRVLTGHQPCSVAWSPDGTRLATGGLDGEVQLCDPASGAQIEVVDAHVDRVEALAWSPDGMRLASGDHSGTVSIHQIGSDADPIRIAVEAGSVDVLAWSPDGTRLAGGGTSGGWVRDPATGEQLSSFAVARSVSAVAWSPDAGRIVSGSIGEVAIWSSDGGERIGSVPADLFVTGALAWSPDGSTLAIGGYGEFALWDPASEEVLRRFGLAESSSVYVMAWSPDGSRLAMGRLVGPVVTVVDPHTGDHLTDLDTSGGGTWGLEWSPDGSRLASAHSDQVRLWDPAAEKHRTGGVRLDHPNGAGVVSWSSDGAGLASTDGGIDPAVLLWDPATGVVAGSLIDRDTWLGAVAWAPRSPRLAVRAGDGHVSIWDPIQRTVIAHLDVGEVRGSSRAMAWSPDGHRLATGGSGEVQLWDPDGRPLDALAGPADDAIAVVSWSPDGTQVAAVGSTGDRTLSVWDVSTGGRLFAVTTGRTGGTRPMCWSPNGSHIATGGGDGGVRLWDPMTGELRMVLPDHGEWVAGLAFAPHRDPAGHDGLRRCARRPGPARRMGGTSAARRTERRGLERGGHRGGRGQRRRGPRPRHPTVIVFVSLITGRPSPPDGSSSVTRSS